MPVSPSELSDYIIKTKYDLSTIFEDIDTKLLSSDLSNDGIYKVEIAPVPDIVAEKIKEVYLRVGWSSVRFDIPKAEGIDPQPWMIITFSVN
jgi:hypothetical protein